MSANPSTTWYWNDWDNDRGLWLCSLAAQGLWMRMLSIAARAGGYVRVGTVACSTEDLSSLIGKSRSEIEPLLAELELRGVFSRTRHGTVYSRRMLRTARRQKINQKNGKLGGAASHGKTREITASVTETATKKSSEFLAPLVPKPLSPLALTQEGKDSAPDGPGADAPAIDPIKEIFDRGVAIVGTKHRSLLGQMRKKYGNPVVLAAIVACETELPSEPVAFMVACCERSAERGSANGTKQSPVDTLREGAARAAAAHILRGRGGGDFGDGFPVAKPLLDRS